MATSLPAKEFQGGASDVSQHRMARSFSVFSSHLQPACRSALSAGLPLSALQHRVNRWAAIAVRSNFSRLPFSGYNRWQRRHRSRCGWPHRPGSGFPHLRSLCRVVSPIFPGQTAHGPTLGTRHWAHDTGHTTNQQKQRQPLRSVVAGCDAWRSSPARRPNGRSMRSSSMHCQLSDSAQKHIRTQPTVPPAARQTDSTCPIRTLRFWLTNQAPWGLCVCGDANYFRNPERS